MPFSGINVSASSSEKKSAFLVFMAMAGYFAVPVYFGLIFGQTNKLNICLGYIFNFDKLTGRLKKGENFP